MSEFLTTTEACAKTNQVKKVIPINSCVYNDNYKFAKCGVVRCKNYNTVTPTNCLALDRVRPDGSKVISDDEIRLYKFTGVKISTRTVSTMRKRYVARVLNMLALAEFIKYIRTNKKKPASEESIPSALCRKIEVRYPLKHVELEFESWMWKHLMDESLWKAFNMYKGSGFGNKDVSLPSMLCVNEAVVAKIKIQSKF